MQLLEHDMTSFNEYRKNKSAKPQFRNKEHGRKFADIDMMHQLGM
jgi:hypothetical protein